MALQAAVPLAGKLLPYLIKAGSAANLPMLLRTAGVVGGAAPGLMRGDLGSALTGGALGGITTLGLGGVAKGAQLAGARGVMKGLTAAGGAPLQVQGALTNLARVAAPVGVGLAAGRLGSGTIGGGAANVARGAAGLAGYGTIGNEGMGGVPLPPGMGPYGNVGPTLRKFSEQAKKDDFARSIAARGIAQNIATNAILTQGMAEATRNLGTRAAEQAGQALTTQYNY